MIYSYLAALFIATDFVLSHPPESNDVTRRPEGLESAKANTALKILPFGDSITSGFASSDDNGYRLTLFEKLSVDYNITFIGNHRDGTMVNNRHEGHPGRDIEWILNQGMPDFNEEPDIILLLAGTNNILQNRSMEAAPRLLAQLLDTVLTSAPSSVVLVGSLPYLRHPLWEGKRPLFNDALPDILKAYTDQGRHVALVSMDVVTRAQINDYDLVHPTDEGYRVIAAQWHKAIVAAEHQGWLRSKAIYPSFPQDDEWGKTTQESHNISHRVDLLYYVFLLWCLLFLASRYRRRWLCNQFKI